MITKAAVDGCCVNTEEESSNDTFGVFSDVSCVDKLSQEPAEEQLPAVCHQPEPVTHVTQ